MHYNYRTVDGYNTPIVTILSKRGLGKTFGAVMKGVWKFVSDGKRFVYVVENLEMVKKLSQNRGEKFFSAILKYVEEVPTRRNLKLREVLFNDESDDTEVTEGDVLNKIQGGTIKINGETAGYIVAFTDFATLKRNNFIDIAYIIIDEFMSEKRDIRNLQYPYMIVSIVQSIARLQNVKIYMLGNTTYSNDIILYKLGLANLKKGEIRVVKDKYGPLVVGHYVDNSQYPEFAIKSDMSVAGRFANLMGETSLDDNTFKDGLPKALEIPSKPKSSHCMICLHNNNQSIRINVTKDWVDYYVMEDYGENVRNRVCIDVKNISSVVKYRPEWKDNLIKKYESGHVYFDTSTSYLIFKDILKIN